MMPFDYFLALRISYPYEFFTMSSYTGRGFSGDKHLMSCPTLLIDKIVLLERSQSRTQQRLESSRWKPAPVWGLLSACSFSFFSPGRRLRYREIHLGLPAPDARTNKAEKMSKMAA